MRVPLGKWPLERMRRAWKDNIKMGFGKVGCENKSRPYLCPGHVGIYGVDQGEEILGARLLWQLNFVQWHLFVDCKCGPCFMSPFCHLEF